MAKIKIMLSGEGGQGQPDLETAMCRVKKVNIQHTGSKATLCPPKVK